MYVNINVTPFHKPFIYTEHYTTIWSYIIKKFQSRALPYPELWEISTTCDKQFIIQKDSTDEKKATDIR